MPQKDNNPRRLCTGDLALGPPARAFTSLETKENKEALGGVHRAAGCWVSIVADLSSCSHSWLASVSVLAYFVSLLVYVCAVGCPRTLEVALLF